MHSTQSNSDDTKTPFNDFDMDTDAVSLISELPRPNNASLILLTLGQSLSVREYGGYDKLFCYLEAT